VACERVAAEAEGAVEMRLTIPDAWAQRVMVAVMQRYGLKAYRRRAQHMSTLRVRAPQALMTTVVMPAYEEICAAAGVEIEAMTDRLIANVILQGDAATR
jgi:hypothetical protein